jgi:hypothetical protein
VSFNQTLVTSDKVNFYPQEFASQKSFLIHHHRKTSSLKPEQSSIEKGWSSAAGSVLKRTEHNIDEERQYIV